MASDQHKDTLVVLEVSRTVKIDRALQQLMYAANYCVIQNQIIIYLFYFGSHHFEGCCVERLCQ